MKMFHLTIMTVCLCDNSRMLDHSVQLNNGPSKQRLNLSLKQSVVPWIRAQDIDPISQGSQGNHTTGGQVSSPKGNDTLPPNPRTLLPVQQ